MNRLAVMAPWARPPSIDEIARLRATLAPETLAVVAEVAAAAHAGATFWLSELEARLDEPAFDAVLQALL